MPAAGRAVAGVRPDDGGGGRAAARGGDAAAPAVGADRGRPGGGGGSRRRGRLGAGLAALAVEGLLVGGLILGLAGPARLRDAVQGGLIAIHVAADPPPAPRPAVHRAHAAGAAGAAARERVAGAATARIPLRPEPVPAAARPDGGTAPASGAAQRGDSGGGAGGSGDGPGAGGTGDGAGGGGSDPELVSGQIRDKDYPRAARDAGHHGVTDTDLAISAEGRVTGCRVVRSSGDADLDATTCALVLRRFRFLPARDAAGRAVAGAVQYTQDWNVDHDAGA